MKGVLQAKVMLYGRRPKIIKLCTSHPSRQRRQTHPTITRLTAKLTLLAAVWTSVHKPGLLYQVCRSVIQQG